jgi:PAS domain S-box-containing protein
MAGLRSFFTGALPASHGLLHTLVATALCFAFAGAPRDLFGATFADSEFLIDSWQTEQGLPENSATAMVQTPDGYLWFGTFAGLVRFDGVKFTVFDPSNTPSLPSPGIVNLHLDASGRLWVSTYRGIVVRDGDRWTSYGRDQGWTGDYARTFSENVGVICITSFDGKVFRVEKGQMQELPEPPGGSGSGYLGHVDRNGRIWVAQHQFFGFWDGQHWVSSDLMGIVTNALGGIGQARDGSLLILASGELLRVSEGKIISRIELSLKIPQTFQVVEDHQGTVWASTGYHGLFAISPGTTVRHYNTDRGLTYNSLRFCFEDKEQNLWVGSSGGGLMRFKRRAIFSYGLESGLPERVVKAVAEEAPGQMLIGTWGRDVVRLKEGRVSRLVNPSDLFVHSLLVDRQRNAWVATYRESLHLIRGLARQVISPEDAGGISTWGLFEDSRGRVWIGGDQTVSVFEGGRFKPHPRTGSLNLGSVLYFAEDAKDGVIWAASPDNLFGFDGAEWKEVKDSVGKSLKDVACLRVDPDGALWVAQAGLGLLRLKQGQWSLPISEQHDLPTRNISSLLDDGLGFWWLGSNLGVIRVAKKDLDGVAGGVLAKLQRQVFNLSDGLQSVECPSGFQSTAMKDSQGRLWFCTLRGVAMVDPQRLRLNARPPPVLIERVVYTDRLGQTQEAQFGGDHSVTLPAGSRELGISFAALSYTAPEKVRFAYQLDSSGGQWVDAGTRRSLNFPTFGPGQFSVKVKAANNDSLWNETGAILHVTVRPFLWQSNAFLAATLFGLVALVGVVARRISHSRLRRQIEQLEQDRALSAERARLAAVLEATSDFVGFADADGYAMFINAAGRRMLGLGEEEGIRHRHIREFHPSWAAEKVLKEGVPATLTEGTWSGETAFLHRDGHEIPVSQVIVAKKAPEGGTEWMATVARDITERKRVEDDLERRVDERTTELTALNKELEAFSYSVSHDLSAPLRNISGFAQLLQKRVDGSADEKSARYLATITDETRRMGILIDSLLDFSKLNRAQLQRIPVNLNLLVTEVQQESMLETQGRSIEWQVEPLPEVLGDWQLLKQVFANLLSNAIKYTRTQAHARITIGCESDSPEEVVVFVKDNGVGFNMKHATKLFGVFQRLHSVKEFEGTGIGLANVQRIVHRHGGRVWAEAEVNQGASFFFTLPKHAGRDDDSPSAREGI